MLSLNIPAWKLFGWFRRPQLWATGDWSFIMTMCLLTYHVSCRLFWQNIKSPMWLGPPTTRLVPCDFWLFPKLKSPLKGKRFQTIDEIQENTMGSGWQLGELWGPKVPTLKGTEASLSYVQCFLYLIFSSIKVSIFHSTCWILFGQTSYYMHIIKGYPNIPHRQVSHALEKWRKITSMDFL